MIIMKMNFIFIMDKIILKEYVKSQGLRQSAQRDLIADTFLSNQGHSSSEELLAAVPEKGSQDWIDHRLSNLKVAYQLRAGC